MTQTTPFCIRFTKEERQYLDAVSGKTPLGTYIRSRLFCKQHPQLSAQNKRGAKQRKTTADTRMLAQILAKQGKMQLAYNLGDLAKAAKSGALFVSPEVEATLIKACSDTATIKTMLMQALDIKED